MRTFDDLMNSSMGKDMSEEENIQMWLVEQISRLTDLSPDLIDLAEPFASYGLDSVAAAGLAGELGNWLGVQVPPTITWDYPSVKLLASHLSAKLSRCVLAA